MTYQIVEHSWAQMYANDTNLTFASNNIEDINYCLKARLQRLLRMCWLCCHFLFWSAIISQHEVWAVFVSNLMTNKIRGAKLFSKIYLRKKPENNLIQHFMETINNSGWKSALKWCVTWYINSWSGGRSCHTKMQVLINFGVCLYSGTIKMALQVLAMSLIMTFCCGIWLNH